MNAPWPQVGMGNADYVAAFLHVLLPLAFEVTGLGVGHQHPTLRQQVGREGSERWLTLRACVLLCG